MIYYETPDLGLSAALITMGYIMQGMHFTGDRAFFTFEKDPTIMDIINSYTIGSLEVEAKSYYYNLRDLKKAIYENQNTQR